MALDRALAAAAEGLGGGFTQEFGPTLRARLQAQLQRELSAAHLQAAQARFRETLSRADTKAGLTRDAAAAKAAAPTAQTIKAQQEYENTRHLFIGGLSSPTRSYIDPSRKTKIPLDTSDEARSFVLAELGPEALDPQQDPALAFLASPANFQKTGFFSAVGGGSFPAVPPEKIRALERAREVRRSAAARGTATRPEPAALAGGDDRVRGFIRAALAEQGTGGAIRDLLLQYGIDPTLYKDLLGD